MNTKIVSLRLYQGDYDRWLLESSKHRLPISTFIKQAVDIYFNYKPEDNIKTDNLLNQSPPVVTSEKNPIKRKKLRAKIPIPKEFENLNIHNTEIKKEVDILINKVKELENLIKVEEKIKLPDPDDPENCNWEDYVELKTPIWLEKYKDMKPDGYWWNAKPWETWWRIEREKARKEQKKTFVFDGELIRYIFTFNTITGKLIEGKKKFGF